MKNLSLNAVFIILALTSCTKKVGINPDLAYTDRALFDSCQNQNYTYYKNDPNTLLSGSAGPHGTFKLRFNSIAAKALTDNGKLPEKASMPDGSMIIKDVYSGGAINIYAFMYKKSGAWLWCETHTNRDLVYSVTKNPSGCTGCHSQQGNRDYVVSFNFY